MFQHPPILSLHSASRASSWFQVCARYRCFSSSEVRYMFVSSTGRCRSAGFFGIRGIGSRIATLDKGVHLLAREIGACWIIDCSVQTALGRLHILPVVSGGVQDPRLWCRHCSGCCVPLFWSRNTQFACGGGEEEHSSAQQDSYHPVSESVPFALLSLRMFSIVWQGGPVNCGLPFRASNV